MLTVLVVDDHVDLLFSVCEMLRPLGCQCIGAPDGASALTYLANNRVDLVVLDLVMPGMDGFAVLDEITRQPEPRPCVIACTEVKERNGENLVDEAAKRGANGILEKPLRKDRLIHEIRRCIGRDWERASSA